MQSRKFAIWLAFCAALLALPWWVGCASCPCPCPCLSGCPRIDPTGESFLIWPNQQPTVTNPFVTAPAVAAVPGNVTAPPVFSDTAGAAFPAVAATPGATAAVSPTNIVGSTVNTAYATGPEDRLTLTPSRVLAPVGSEVILRAGVCSASGYYIVNQRVEWMIDRAGPGQIVTVGERGQLDMFRCPQNTPRKVDNWYAIGATIPYHICLDRGTANTADDLQIRPGEAWISVSSATEGTSYVTAYSPAVGNWPGRTNRATIIWVDAQWEFPPSVTLPAGQPHVLVTRVTRQSDGMPVAGYIVRYEVAGGGAASLGYGAGQSSEVTTDSQGLARMEITPIDATPGSTTVNIQVIRPEQPGAAAGARVTLGSGATTLTWAGAGASPIPQLPPGRVPPPSGEPPQPLPFNPPAREPDVPPLGTTTPGQPQLDVAVKLDTPGPFNIDDRVIFTVTVRNRGTAPAKNIVVASDFDAGLSHLQAESGATRVEYKGMRELAPGESESVELGFTITQAGEQCQRVTVTADGVSVPAVDRGCVTVAAAAPTERPTLRVEMSRDRIKTVGEITELKTLVENVGTVPARNLVLDIRSDRQFLVAVERDRDLTPLTDGTLRVQIPELAPGDKREFPVKFRCEAPSVSACANATVSGDNDLRYEAESCLEIRPRLEGEGPAAGQSNLRLTITDFGQPTRVGTQTTILVNLDNTGLTSERNIRLLMLFPPGLTVDTTKIQPQNSFQVVNREQGLELQFTPIAELRANEQQRYVIPITPNRAGVSTIMAQYGSDSTPQPLQQQREITTIDR